MPQTRLVVVVRGHRRDEVRRAVCAGADGVVEEAQLELTLGVVVRSVALGQASVPRSMRASLTADATDLSRREEQVLELLVQDLSNAAIAARLCVAECTVKSHVAAVLSKLGVVGRDEAVAVARRAITDITYTRENDR
jgi:DNA-binding NarL/FixJ family response regulator